MNGARSKTGLPIFEIVGKRKVGNLEINVYNSKEKPLYKVADIVNLFGSERARYITRYAISHVAERDKVKGIFYNGGGNPPAWFVNEKGASQIWAIATKSSPGVAMLPEKNEKDNALMTVGAKEAMVFNNPEFGSLRMTFVDDTPWFVGKDVAKLLGYSSPRRAIESHVSPQDKEMAKWHTQGGKQKLCIINESGLYSLILSSKLATAKKFRHWVTSDILPSLRKENKISLPAAPSNDTSIAKTLQEISKAVAAISERQDKIEEYIGRADKMFEAMELTQEKIINLLATASLSGNTKEDNTKQGETEYPINIIAREMHWYTEKGGPHYAFTRAVARACGINASTIYEHEDEYSRCVRYYEDGCEAPRFRLYIKDAGIDLMAKWCDKYDNGRACRVEEKYKTNGADYNAGDIKEVYYLVKNMIGKPVDNRHYFLVDF